MDPRRTAAVASILLLVGCKPNQPPAVTYFSGTTSARIDSTCTFRVSAADPEGKDVSVRIYWADGDTSNWSAPFGSGDSAVLTRIWTSGGTYRLQAQARDDRGVVSAWSDTFHVTIQYNFRPEPPATPRGPRISYAESTCIYQTHGADIDGDSLRFRLALGNGETTAWSVRVPSDSPADLPVKWALADTYVLSAQSQDTHGAVSDWYGATNVWVVNAPPQRPRWVLDIEPDTGEPSTYSSPAIGTDGTIYVGSDAGLLCAINPDGTVRWTYATGGPINSDPSIGPDGTVYVGSYDDYIYAIDPSGSVRWRADIGNVYRGVAPAIAGDGSVFVGSMRHYFHRLSPDGTLLWRYHTSDDVRSSAAAAADSSIYVGSRGDTLYAFLPDSATKWRRALGDDVDAGVAIGRDSTVYVGTEDDFLWALRPDGSARWKVYVGRTSSTTPVVGMDGTVYAASTGLLAVNPDGTLRWYFPAHCATSMSPALAADGTIYCGIGGVGLGAVNPDGTLRWVYLHPVPDIAEGIGNVQSAISIGTDGTVYFTTSDGYLHALPGTSPLANSPWPKAHHDLQNTGRVGGP